MTFEISEESKNGSRKKQAEDGEQRRERGDRQRDQHRDPGETVTRENTSEAAKWIEHQQFKLLKVQEVPDHHKEISIFGGYRQRLEYKDCLWSIFKLHNETVNIWTHLIGFLIFFSLMVRDALWGQEHIRDVTDLAASLLQLITYQVWIWGSELLCHHNKHHITGVHVVKLHVSHDVVS
mgnify:CR=1 FL=1